MSTLSLFEPSSAAALLARLNGLEATATARWGRMDVAQMLAHCQPPIRIALGDVVRGRSLIGRLFGRMAKRSLFSDKPWRHGLPTDPTFVVKDARGFAPEKAKLLALVERLVVGGPTALARGAHPFFGRLTTAEWDALMARHLDHHLRQFGA